MNFPLEVMGFSVKFSFKPIHWGMVICLYRNPIADLSHGSVWIFWGGHIRWLSQMELGMFPKFSANGISRIFPDHLCNGKRCEGKKSKKTNKMAGCMSINMSRGFFSQKRVMVGVRFFWRVLFLHVPMRWLLHFCVHFLAVWAVLDLQMFFTCQEWCMKHFVAEWRTCCFYFFPVNPSFVNL